LHEKPLKRYTAQSPHGTQVNVGHGAITVRVTAVGHPVPYLTLLDEVVGRITGVGVSTVVSASTTIPSRLKTSPAAHATLSCGQIGGTHGGTTVCVTAVGQGMGMGIRTDFVTGGGGYGASVGSEGWGALVGSVGLPVFVVVTSLEEDLVGRMERKVVGQTQKGQWLVAVLTMGQRMSV
jgi:hypothetical protein